MQPSNQAPAVHHPPETQHIERCPQQGQGRCGGRPAACLPHRGRPGLHRGAGLGRMAAVLRQVEQALQELPQARRERLLHGLLHLPELRPPSPIHDIHHQLDRAAAEGLPPGDEDARGDANEESVILLMGKTAMDKTSYRREAGVQNRPRQGAVLRQMNLPLRGARRDEQ